MRRGIAILVFVAVALPVWAAAAAWAWDSPFTVPACCRRDGKHHCSMLVHLTSQNTDPSGAAISSNACPYRSGAQTWSSGNASYSNPPAEYFGELRSHPAVHAQTQAKFRISAIRANLKRGPPVRSL
jgi:hypothetical protein